MNTDTNKSAKRIPHAKRVACTLLMLCVTATACAVDQQPAAMRLTAPAAKSRAHLSAFRSQAELDALLKQWRTKSERKHKRELAKMQESAVPPPPPAPMAAADAGAALESVAAVAGAQAEDSITNVQTEGVDEGGIVKKHGDYLVILRRGRLFTVKVGGDALQPVSMVDAYAPNADPKQAWYDEMLISGNRVVVIGYSYGHAGTEIGLFDLSEEGKITYRDTYYLRSNDYYSANNYASRLIGSTLIFYTPLQYNPWSADGLLYPGLDRWRGREVPQNFQRLLPAEQIYRADQGLDPTQDDIALHTVTRCELASVPMQCSSIGVLGPGGRVFYVSRDAVYVWTLSQQWNNRDKPKPGVAIRLPMNGSAPSALRVRGAPIDQLSFLEDDSGSLNVLLQAQGAGEGMWLHNWNEGRMALLRVPLTDFGTINQAASTQRYRLLPALAEGNRQNRYVGDWLLYGNAPYVQDAHSGEQAYALRYAADQPVIILNPSHSIERIEAMGSDAVLVGNQDQALVFSAVALRGEKASLQSTYRLPNAVQGESRTHGFFYRKDGEAEGVLGLPILRATSSRQQWFDGMPENSASVFYLRNHRLKLGPLGELAAHANWRDDACKASCVDWYGNARPIFIGKRVFALMGYELVEGTIENDVILERRRVDFAPSPVKISRD